MFHTRNEKEANSTKHKEYSLLPATILIVGLPFFYSYFSSQVIGLWIISLISFLVISGNIFSVYRHGDVLAHRLPYSWLIHIGIGSLLFVGLVELFMTASSYGEFLLCESSFSILMLLIGGGIGLVCFVTPHFKDGDGKMSFLLPYLGFLFVLYLLVFLLPGSFVEVGLSKLQLVILVFFCLFSCGWLIVFYSQEKERVVLFTGEDKRTGIFAFEADSPFSSYWHSGWLFIHLVAVFSVVWVFLPYAKKTLLSEEYSPQWVGLFLALLLVAPIIRGMINYAQEGKMFEAIRIAIFLEIGRMGFGISILVGFAIWMKQGIILALNLPQAILVGGRFIFLVLFSLAAEKQKSLKILGISHF